MPAALIWLISALGLAAAEALTGDMFPLMLSGGALAAAGSSWLFGLPLWADGVVFLVVSILLLGVVRPTLRRRLDRGQGTAGAGQGAGGQARAGPGPGRRHQGQVKLDGEVWTRRARSATRMSTSRAIR